MIDSSSAIIEVVSQREQHAATVAKLRLELEEKDDVLLTITAELEEEVCEEPIL